MRLLSQLSDPVEVRLFKIKENYPSQVVWKAHNKLLLSYSRQYIDLCPAFDVHAIDPEHGASEILIIEIFKKIWQNKPRESVYVPRHNVMIEQFLVFRHLDQLESNNQIHF